MGASPEDETVAAALVRIPFELTQNSIPFVPAKAGTQSEPSIRSQVLGPRFRGDERRETAPFPFD
jgi:hypothetical protein